MRIIFGEIYQISWMARINEYRTLKYIGKFGQTQLKDLRISSIKIIGSKTMFLNTNRISTTKVKKGTALKTTNGAPNWDSNKKKSVQHR